MLRMKTLESIAWRCMRIRSPRIAPPVNGELGSVATTATDFSCFRSQATRPSTRVDLPVPGEPVKPTTPGCAPPRIDRSNARTVGSRRSTRLIARARARVSPDLKRSARSASFRSLLAQETLGEVAAEDHHDAGGLLAAGGGRVAWRCRDDGASEKSLQPLGS